MRILKIKNIKFKMWTILMSIEVVSIQPSQPHEAPFFLHPVLATSGPLLSLGRTVKSELIERVQEDTGNVLKQVKSEPCEEKEISKTITFANMNLASGKALKAEPLEEQSQGYAWCHGCSFHISQKSHSLVPIENQWIRPLLASGGSSGVICIWNLEKQKLHSVIREAHDSSIVSLHFFANEPVLMSSATDNSIKIWIFDTSDGDARLLRYRSGHSAPSLCIRFYRNGRCILSAGQDRAFRLFSIIQDQQSRELSQCHITRRAKKLKMKEEEIKLKPVIAFDVAEIRERDWCNVVTCHMDTPRAYVWHLQNFVLGEHILTPSTDQQTPVKACTISACGNFAIIGTEGGWIERFNLQSGISRGSYVDISESHGCAHDGEVVGVACDATNRIMISTGYHGGIKVWDIKVREVISRLEVGYSVIKIVYHRTNGLLATVADDMVLHLFDVVALRMVRKFVGHTDRITDLCFSEDGKWLLSSSMDGTLRIWDVILARQIDALQTDVCVTALSLSPSMDILATSHVDQNGVYLWVNQFIFSGSSNIESYASGNEVQNAQLPSISSKERSEVQIIGFLLDYFIHELSSKNNIEFIQAVIKLFLKIHGEIVRMHSNLQEKAKRLLEVQCLV